MTQLADRPAVEPATVPPHEHPAFLAHHFETAPQQFEAAKLGMWMFLATEVLLFGGLFCGYAVWRANHPEMFRYGSQYLDTFWGGLNTVVLILSSVTAATAVTAVQRGRRGALCVLLSMTFLGGAVFMGVKFVEYRHKFHNNLVPGLRFYQDPHPAEHAAVEATAEALPAPDPARGRTLWMGTCRSCHGEAGEGIAGQGKDIRGSEFIASRNDEELLAFVKAGRMPFDRLNTTGIQMPPRGGNPLLKDPDLRDVLAYVRTFRKPEGETAAEAAAAPPAGEPPPSEYIPRSTIPPAPAGPPGVLLGALEPSGIPEQPEHPPFLPSRDPEHRPANAHMFFVFYFLMTGLHGIHVLAGMGAMAWLLLGALQRRFTAAWYTPVDLGALYWHIVDLIWIFLFPLFYLI